MTSRVMVPLTLTLWFVKPSSLPSELDLTEALVVKDVFYCSGIDEYSPDVAAVDTGSDGYRLFHHGGVGGELLLGERDYVFVFSREGTT